MLQLTNEKRQHITENFEQNTKEGHVIDEQLGGKEPAAWITDEGMKLTKQLDQMACNR